MGKHTNTSRKFYSAWRIGQTELTKTLNYKRSQKPKKPATEKQIAYIDDMKANIEKLGITDYPMDSNYQSNQARATTYIKQLNNFITKSGLREAIDKLKGEEDGCC